MRSSAAGAVSEGGYAMRISVQPVRLVILVFTLGLAVMHGGCTTVQPPVYYLLEPAAQTGDRDGTGQACMIVGMRQVEVPSYLDRRQIMISTGRNELAVSEFNQWAEPLKENITRVIAQNLESLTCADVADIRPAERSKPVDYRLKVRVNRLEGSLGGQAVLDAEWLLTAAGDSRTIASRRSRFVKPVPGKDHASLVTAHSELITDLSREMARAFAALPEALSRIRPEPGE